MYILALPDAFFEIMELVMIRTEVVDTPGNGGL